MHPTPLYRRNTKLTSAHGYLPAIALMLVGMVIVTKVLLLGLFLLLMAISALTLGEGVEIDFQQNRIRIFLGLFGLRFGKWEALPLMERITLVEVEQKQLLASRVHPTAEVSVACAQVRLYAQGSLEYYLASQGSYASALADARLLAQCFKLSFEDFTAAGGLVRK